MLILNDDLKLHVYCYLLEGLYFLHTRKLKMTLRPCQSLNTFQNDHSYLDKYNQNLVI